MALQNIRNKLVKRKLELSESKEPQEEEEFTTKKKVKKAVKSSPKPKVDRSPIFAPECDCVCCMARGDGTEANPLLCIKYDRLEGFVPGHVDSSSSFIAKMFAGNWSDNFVVFDACVHSRYPYCPAPDRYYIGDWTIREYRAVLFFIRYFTHRKLRLIRTFPRINNILRFRDMEQIKNMVYALVGRSKDVPAPKVSQFNFMFPSTTQYRYAYTGFEFRGHLFNNWLAENGDSCLGKKPFDFDEFLRKHGHPGNCFTCDFA